MCPPPRQYSEACIRPFRDMEENEKIVAVKELLAQGYEISSEDVY